MMSLTSFIVVCGGLVFMFHISLTGAADYTCGKPVIPPSKNFKIVGGDLVQNNSWPWACALVQEIPRFGKMTYRQFCGCTVIDKEWVMTAAHCAFELSDAQFLYYVKVYVGDEDLDRVKENPAKKFNVSQLIVHKGFIMSSKHNDIALVKLNRPISTYTEEIRAACLPSEDVNEGTFPEKGSKDRRLCYVGGWGHTFAGERKIGVVGSGSDKMRQTAIEIYPHKDCKYKLPVYTETMFCGGYDRGGKDSCQGDSGGPMVCEDDEKTWKIYGIVSWGTGCARAGAPGVYTNVNKMKAWITESTKVSFDTPSSAAPNVIPGTPDDPPEGSSAAGKADSQTVAPPPADADAVVIPVAPPVW